VPDSFIIFIPCSFTILNRDKVKKVNAEGREATLERCEVREIVPGADPFNVIVAIVLFIILFYSSRRDFSPIREFGMTFLDILFLVDPKVYSDSFFLIFFNLAGRT